MEHIKLKPQLGHVQFLAEPGPERRLVEQSHAERGG